MLLSCRELFTKNVNYRSLISYQMPFCIFDGACPPARMGTWVCWSRAQLTLGKRWCSTSWTAQQPVACCSCMPLYETVNQRVQWPHRILKLDRRSRTWKMPPYIFNLCSTQTTIMEDLQHFMLLGEMVHPFPLCCRCCTAPSRMLHSSF